MSDFKFHTYRKMQDLFSYLSYALVGKKLVGIEQSTDAIALVIQGGCPIIVMGDSWSETKVSVEWEGADGEVSSVAQYLGRAYNWNSNMMFELVALNQSKERIFTLSVLPSRRRKSQIAVTIGSNLTEFDRAEAEVDAMCVGVQSLAAWLEGALRGRVASDFQGGDGAISISTKDGSQVTFSVEGGANVKQKLYQGFVHYNSSLSEAMEVDEVTPSFREDNWMAMMFLNGRWSLVFELEMAIPQGVDWDTLTFSVKARHAK